jgi:hypothetical protein
VPVPRPRPCAEAAGIHRKREAIPVADGEHEEPDEDPRVP